MGILAPKPEFKNQRLLLRFAIGLLILAGLVFGYQALQTYGQDPDILKGESAGMIAALKYEGDGAKVVVFDSTGKETAVPGWTEGDKDDEPVWRPDGQRLFFSSDREENTFHIYRWRPGAESAERRSVGTRSKGTPWFGPKGYALENETALITSSGFVVEYSPKDGSTRQVLPPPQGSGTAVGEDGGSIDQFAAIYEKIGESFKTARYGKDRRFVIATMRREDGDVLMYQDFELAENGILPAPVPIIAGETVEFDVAPDGTVTATVHNFRWLDPDQIPEEFIEGGVAKPPFRYGMVSFNPADPTSLKVLYATDEKKDVVTGPRYSPDGSKVLFTVGSIGSGEQFEPKGLIVAPAGQPLGEGTPLINAAVFEPSWTLDGASVLYAKREGGNRTIFRLNVSTGDETAVSPKTGEYGFPVMSPQVK